jgi:glutamate-1-semialdehyde 2,1-aminomutase
MWGYFFTPGSVRDFKGAQGSDTALFRRFFHACLERGVYLPPSPFEACFVSTAHNAEVLDRTADVFQEAVKTAGDTGPGA